jgi:hypothetical protein
VVLFSGFEKDASEIGSNPKKQPKILTCHSKNRQYGEGRTDHAENGRKYNGSHDPEMA